jgi:hypothetical protein
LFRAAATPPPTEATRQLPRIETADSPPYEASGSSPGPRRGTHPAAAVGIVVSACAVVGLVIGAVLGIGEDKPATVKDSAPAPKDPGAAPSEPPATEAPAYSLNTPYLMLNTTTGKAADMYGASREDGAVLIAYQPSGDANQQWLFKDAGDGYVHIASVLSGKCLQSGTASAPDQSITQTACSTADNQRWKLAPASTGAYTVVPKGSTLVWGNSNHDDNGSQQIELQRPDPQRPQAWTLQPAD